MPKLVCQIPLSIAPPLVGSDQGLYKVVKSESLCQDPNSLTPQKKFETKLTISCNVLAIKMETNNLGVPMFVDPVGLRNQVVQFLGLENLRVF